MKKFLFNICDVPDQIARLVIIDPMAALERLPLWPHKWKRATPASRIAHILLFVPLYAALGIVFAINVVSSAGLVMASFVACVPLVFFRYIIYGTRKQNNL